jgi:WhiB family redox-sensing transcriptional regulator
LGSIVNPKGLSDFDWHDEAECAKPKNKRIAKLFFSNVPSEKYEARNLCFTCPVRKECLKWALEHKEIWGVWGGKDEAEIRRALSVSHTGQEIRRQRFPNCPYCGARPSKLKVIIADSPEGGRWTKMKLVSCEECEFTWRSRTSANAVTAYHASKKSGSKKTIPVLELQAQEEEDPQDFHRD